MRRGRESVEAYGVDLMMLAEGELFVTDDHLNLSRGDIRDVGGLLNYAQAITHRLMTDRGTHPEDRFFGVPWRNYVGQTYTSRHVVKAQLTADITEELYRDHRTGQVVEVKTIFSSPTVVEVSCSVIPKMFRNDLVSVALAVEGE